MREIKFRQWHDGRMYYWGFGVNDDGSYFTGPSSGARCSPHKCPQMQFTGLHDKNGKEIYEGDIVDSSFHGYGGVIEMVNGCFQVRMQDRSLYILSENGPVEIIGNVYENPDLLTGQSC